MKPMDRQMRKNLIRVCRTSQSYRKLNLNDKRNWRKDILRLMNRSGNNG